jgi:hypothetical protein
LTNYDLNEALKSFKEQKQKFVESAKEGLKEAFVNYFELNPNANAVVWTQYAPYFNDGDPCVFSVNEITVTNATGSLLEDSNILYGEIDEDDDDYKGIFAYSLGYLRKEETQVDHDSSSALGNLLSDNDMSDVMESMFGDSVRVIATREGFDVEEYDHD